MISISVLLVEDNRGDALFVERRLGAAGRLKFTVDRVEWLSTALMMLRNRKFDIVFLDLSLPDSHGIDTVIAVKKEAPATPVIVLSAQEDLNIAARSMEAGADNFVVKRSELTTDELEREVLYAMERSRRDRVSKELIHRSLEKLTVDVDRKQPVLAGMMAEHIERVDTVVATIRLFLQRNHPGAAENVEQMLVEQGYYIAMQEIRNLLHMDDRIHTQKTQRILDVALDEVRGASAGEDVSNPEQELLRIIGGDPLGDSDEQ